MHWWSNSIKIPIFNDCAIRWCTFFPSVMIKFIHMEREWGCTYEMNVKIWCGLGTVWEYYLHKYFPTLSQCKRLCRVSRHAVWWQCTWKNGELIAYKFEIAWVYHVFRNTKHNNCTIGDGSKLSIFQNKVSY